MSGVVRIFPTMDYLHKYIEFVFWKSLLKTTGFDFFPFTENMIKSLKAVVLITKALWELGGYVTAAREQNTMSTVDNSH